MNSKQQDSIQFYKQIEADLNKRIHARTNSRAFTAEVGKTMDSHLRELRIYKRLTTRWLTRLDLSTKDELAALSNRMVDVVGEIDSLDESIYQIINLQKANQRKLTMVRETLKECSAFFKKEVSDQRSNYIRTLENDLQELKKLFEMDITKEEIDHD